MERGSTAATGATLGPLLVSGGIARTSPTRGFPSSAAAVLAAATAHTEDDVADTPGGAPARPAPRVRAPLAPPSGFGSEKAGPAGTAAASIPVERSQQRPTWSCVLSSESQRRCPTRQHGDWASSARARHCGYLSEIRIMGETLEQSILRWHHRDVHMFVMPLPVAQRQARMRFLHRHAHAHWCWVQEKPRRQRSLIRFGLQIKWWWWSLVDK
jgi:hypothetical protein